MYILVQIIKQLKIPYIITKGKPTVHEYKGWIYELPTNEYEWIPDDTWYSTKATQSERDFVDKYVELIYNAVKYVRNKEDRKSIILKMVPSSEMPKLGLRQQIIHQFFKTKKYDL